MTSSYQNMEFLKCLRLLIYDFGVCRNVKLLQCRENQWEEKSLFVFFSCLQRGALIIFSN